MKNCQMRSELSHGDGQTIEQIDMIMIKVALRFCAKSPKFGM